MHFSREGNCRSIERGTVATTSLLSIAFKKMDLVERLPRDGACRHSNGGAALEISMSIVKYRMIAFCMTAQSSL
jgi:hypothetical protein